MRISESIPASKRPFLQTFDQLESLIADLLPDESQPDGCLTYFFECRNPWSGAIHMAKCEIRKDATTVKQAKTITNKICKDIKSKIAKYKRCFPREMAKLKKEQEQRELAKAERELAKAEREREEAEDRELNMKHYPDLADGDFIFAGGWIWSGKEQPAVKPKAHNLDDRLPDEKASELWLRPHDFWTATATEEIRQGMVPEIIWNVASEYAVRTGVDADALIMSMLTICSAVIPTEIKVSAFNQDDLQFVEALRIWQANVGVAGSGKSSIMKAVLKALNEIEARYLKEYREAKASFNALSKDDQKNTDKPVRRRVMMPDASTESAQLAFADNPNDGLALTYDELISFFGAMSRHSNKSGGGEQSASGFWLSVYDSVPYSSSRISREDVDCDPSGSLIGGIQPKVLSDLLTSTSLKNGLVQRFQPVIMTKRMNEPVVIEQPKYPFSIYDQLVKNMHERMPLRLTGATLHFSPKAEAVRDALFKWVAEKTEFYENNNPQLSMHLSKYKGMFLRYCGVFHVIEHYGDKHARPISHEIASMVYKFMTSSRYTHAKAFYTMLRQNAEDDDMRNVAELILSRALCKVDSRTIQNGSSRFDRLTSREIANTADAMIALGWLTRIVGKRVDSHNWQVNPDVHRIFAGRAGLIRERNAQAVANIEAAKRAAKERDNQEE
jgi:Protein of unknown function (DUF3987)